MYSFSGIHRYAVDHKGRINIPSPFRKMLTPEADNTFVISRGLEGCLFGYPLDEWKRVEERLRALPLTQKNARFFVRMLVSHAFATQLDRQGRIGIPKELLELAAISDTVLILGALDRIEFWQPTRYQQYIDDFGQSYEEVAESLLF